jgi:hypothetical protein
MYHFAGYFYVAMFFRMPFTHRILISLFRHFTLDDIISLLLTLSSRDAARYFILAVMTPMSLPR